MNGKIILVATAAVIAGTLCGCERSNPHGERAEAREEGLEVAAEDVAEYAAGMEQEIGVIEDECQMVEARMESRLQQIGALRERRAAEGPAVRLDVMMRRVAMIEEELTNVALGRANMESAGAGDANEPGQDARRPELERLGVYEGRLRGMAGELEAEMKGARAREARYDGGEHLELMLEADRAVYGQLRQRLSDLKTELRLVRVGQKMNDKPLGLVEK